MSNDRLIWWIWVNFRSITMGSSLPMVVIDILSKYPWFEPLKSKHGIAIKNALEHVFSETIRWPKVIQTDKGTQFFNVLVKIYLANKNIKLFATHSERKAQIVERLNRTIKGIMFRYFTKKNTRSYIDIVQDIASNYNASYHRTIKVAPKNVNKNKKTQVWINEEKNEEKKRRKKSNLT